MDSTISKTYKQSNLFFGVGATFIALLYIISLTNLYSVQLNSSISRILVIYLWGIIALAIVIMFPIFSISSYFIIKKLISQLVENAIIECNSIQQIVLHKRKKQKHLELIHELTQLKILLLEKTPVYPQKPFFSYAFSFIVAILNFVTTVDATLELVNYFK